MVVFAQHHHFIQCGAALALSNGASVVHLQPMQGRDVAARGHAACAVVLEGGCSQAFVAFPFEVRLEDQ